MLKYDDRIFNEMQEVTVNPMINEYFMETIYPQLTEKEGEEPLCVWSINKSSMLWKALQLWYKNKKPLDHIRSAVENDGIVYFVTGYGYDIISSDLLDGQPDGQAKREFLNLLNN